MGAASRGRGLGPLLRADPGFSFADRSCEPTRQWETARSSILDRRHLIGHAIVFLVAALALGRDRIATAAAATFPFSIPLEVEQSFFATGHCRAWDLIPNIVGIVGIGVAATIVRVTP